MKDYTVKKGTLLIFMNCQRRGSSYGVAHIGEVKGFEKAKGCNAKCYHIHSCGGNFEKIVIKWEDRSYTNISCYNREVGLDWLGQAANYKLIIIRNDIQKGFFNLFRKDR